MAFPISPGVTTKEIDLTTIVPSVATTPAAFCGPFQWGPVEEITLIDTENRLRATFGGPAPDTSANNAGQAVQWLCAADFLSYGNNLYVVRACGDLANNAVSALSNGSGVKVKNLNDYTTKDEAASLTGYGEFIAKYPGVMGNSLKVSLCPAGNAFSSNITANLQTTGLSNIIKFGDQTTISIASAAVVANVGNTVVQVYSPANVIPYLTGSGYVVLGGNAYSYANVTQNTFTISDFAGSNITSSASFTLTGANFKGTTLLSGDGNDFIVGDVLTIGADKYGTLAFSNAKQEVTLSRNYSNNGPVYSGTSVSFGREWEFAEYFNGNASTSAYVSNLSGSNDEVHVVVVDEDGLITGTPGSQLERYAYLSVAGDAKNSDGQSNFYKDVINRDSAYVWFANRPAAGTNWTDGAQDTDFTVIPLPVTRSLVGGRNDNDTDAVASARITGYSLFEDTETTDISVFFTGEADATLVQHLIDNVVGKRLDSIVVFSPEASDTISPTQTLSQKSANVIAYRNSIGRSSSYAVMDSGHRVMYDRYNDKNRNVPLNSGTAGIIVRSDEVTAPWFSPAGFNRGAYRNVVKLHFNPTKPFRDDLYKASINPVVSFTGQGIYLYGDKTLTSKPSAFDRINVRRLFNVLKKSISRAAQYSLFEFNDAFTRAQFRNLVNPYLADVQGARGIYDFKVVCDETNNPGSVIDRNEFVGDIYIKPARSTNFITLNFIAVGTSVDFNVVGA